MAPDPGNQLVEVLLSLIRSAGLPIPEQYSPEIVLSAYALIIALVVGVVTGVSTAVVSSPMRVPVMSSELSKQTGIGDRKRPGRLSPAPQPAVLASEQEDEWSSSPESAKDGEMEQGLTQCVTMPVTA